MSSSTETIVKTLRVLAREIQCDDGVANAAIGEAADRLEQQDERIKRLEEAGDRMYWTLEDQETGSVGKGMWNKAKEAKP